ncbi:MAG: transglycosylase SLT domain-containing protein [Bradymonadaceae bacterium]|nr:transglycosylase SLT domain-containing protein [Lujinxingiaceae bacterium]
MTKALTLPTHPGAFFLALICLGLGAPSLLAQDRSPSPVADALPSRACSDPVCIKAQTAIDGGKYKEAAQFFVQRAEAVRAAQPPQLASYIDWALRAAHAHEKAASFDDAARFYLEASRHDAELKDFLRVQAGRSIMLGSRTVDLLKDLRDSDSLKKGYAGSQLLLAQIEAVLDSGLPTQASMKTALDSSSKDDACAWLVTSLAQGAKDKKLASRVLALADLGYGYCVDEAHTTSLAALVKRPSDAARLRRSEYLLGQVRFREAHEQLKAIDFKKLTATDRCSAHFRTARAIYRLRQPDNASTEYMHLVDHCKDKLNQGERIRAIYAVGRRHFEQNRIDEAQPLFETLLADYPKASHADDALFYLARIERKRSNTAKEHELLARALRDYPGEDMVHEMVWEVHESLFRQKKFKEFIAAIARLELPDRDDQYFSQGRLEYFVALAHFRLKEPQKAYEYWQRAWAKYPFSFYGYVSHLRLGENKQVVPPITVDASSRTTPWFGGDWKATGGHRLASLSMYEGACDFEATRQRTIDSTDTDRWRLATLCHAAGRFPLSHNIARRQISGSPWLQPGDARLVRWEVAWPDPFGEKIAAAIAAEAPQWKGPTVHRAFPTSIMREESSFIEDVTSWAGALGLMQLMPKTALDHDKDIEGRATPERLKTADVNIRVGVDHIFHLANRFDSHPVLMAAAYNAGGGRINGWLGSQPNDDIALWVEDIPYLETRDYTKRVIGSYAAYQWLLGQTELDAKVARPAKR